VTGITVDVWLYGPLARHGKEADQGSFANLQITLPEGSSMADLLQRLRINPPERGITFINGQLSALPGLQPDLTHVLGPNDRVAIFHPKSMWPFQYRHGVIMTEKMTRAMAEDKDRGLHHTYEK